MFAERVIAVIGVVDDDASVEANIGAAVLAVLAARCGQDTFSRRGLLLRFDGCLVVAGARGLAVVVLFRLNLQFSADRV